ncbi:MAG: hypothetical protein Q8R15_04190, partial [Candidatus Micrarchaeota archaeon]|nr:hypothetical protein [Candidatus Micrarchaeota archaeon]
SMAKKLIASVKLGDSYFSKISNLNSLANNLRNLREVYSGKVDEGEKLNLKIEIRNLQRMAKAAVVKEIAGAGEIEKSLTSIYELVGETSNTGELQQLEEQTNENREMLTKLIEDKIGGALRQTYNNAQALAAENSLTNLEEKKLGEISDAFSGSGQLAEKISEVDEIQTTLNNIIENALKRKTTSLSSNATNGNITSVNSTASYLTAMAVQKKNESPGQQSETNASTFEVRELLKQLDEITSAGLEAFYTDGRTTKKTLEQLKFETSLKKAQAEAKNIQKNPSGQKTSELKKQIGEMDSAIQEAQRKASVEIAIAEQRSNGTNKEVEKAQQSWESGKYTDALLKAQEINREQQQTSLQQSGKITGQITSAGDEPKLWAIGVSLVIILIGAAYLMYMKRNGNNDQFEQQPS